VGRIYYPPDTDHPCTRGAGEVPVVQSDVTLVDAPAIDLPTSDRASGEAMRALISGLLHLDEQDYVLVGGFVAVWPAGYTAVLSSTHGLELRGPDGELVAWQGDRIKTGGGYLQGQADHPCTDGRDEIAYVQSEVAVVP
jgi:hypothetical protein